MFEKLCQYCNEEEKARRGVLDRKERKQGKRNARYKTVSLLFIVLHFFYPALILPIAESAIRLLKIFHKQGQRMCKSL